MRLKDRLRLCRSVHVDFLVSIREGNTERCKQLLDDGMDPNHSANDFDRGRPPLLTATRRGYTEIVRLLLEKGAQVNDASAGSGESALHIAAWNGYAQITHILLRQGADVHARNHQGKTPLHHAATQARVQVARTLMDAGAKETERDNFFETPLDAVRQKSRSSRARRQIEDLFLKEHPKKLDTLLTVFFCKTNVNDVHGWFERMADSVQNVHECRIFYTILKASLALHIMPPDVANGWAAKVLGQTALLSKSSTSLNLLFLIVAKAYSDQMIDDDLYAKLNDYRKHKVQTSNAGISPDIRFTIRKSVALMNGLEGTEKAVGLSLRFLFARLDKLRDSAERHRELKSEASRASAEASKNAGGGGRKSSPETNTTKEGTGNDGSTTGEALSKKLESLDGSDAPLSERFRVARIYASNVTVGTLGSTGTRMTTKTEKTTASTDSVKLIRALHRARIESVVGFIGVVLNSMLMGVETYGASFNHLLQFVVDFGDPVHIQKIIATEFEFEKATSLRKHVTYGVNVARRVAKLKVKRGKTVVQEAEEYLQVVIGRKDPLVNLGFCTVIFDAVKKTDPDDDSAASSEDWDMLSRLSSDLEVLTTVSPLPSIGSADYGRNRRATFNNNGGLN
jgi:hypothetical protein